MPPYPGNDLAKLIYENQQAFFFQNEAAPANSLSQAFQLRRERGASYPWGFSVEAAFSGAPGAFELDVMGADTDNANYFVSLATITAVNTNNVGRVDVQNFWPKYVALFVKTLTNSVSLTAQLTR